MSKFSKKLKEIKANASKDPADAKPVTLSQAVKKIRAEGIEARRVYAKKEQEKRKKEVNREMEIAAGRPYHEAIEDPDWLEKAKKYARAGANGEEIAAALGLSRDGFIARIVKLGYPGVKPFCQEHADGGKAAIRLAQYETAVEDRNVPMLIFLGKVVLQQYERQQLEHVTVDLSKVPTETLMQMRAAKEASTTTEEEKEAASALTDS